MRKLLALSAIVGWLLLGATSIAQAQTLRLPHKPWNHMTRTEKIHYLKKQKWHDNSILRYWHNHGASANMQAAHFTQWARISLRIVTKNLHKLMQQGVSGSDIAAWMCIHSYEGSWTDSGSPYWGGLQMDLGFQETYGGKFLRTLGTADHWPIGIQILVARRARDGYGRHGPRGYTPWPNTARYCGLLS